MSYSGNAVAGTVAVVTPDPARFLFACMKLLELIAEAP